MDFNEKLAAAKRLLDSRGISPRTYASPLYRMFWRFGVPVVPPHFGSILVNAVTMGGFFGFAWTIWMGALIWFGVLPHRPMPAQSMLGLFLFMVLLAGSLFGLAMALYFRYGARKHGIPAWADFDPRATNS